MIGTVTVNPAIDRLLFIKEFVRDNTNRIQRTKNVLGGKGTHVSINLGILGCKNKAYGIVLGENGRQIEQMLKEAGVETQFLHYEQGESRMNYAVIEENHRCTLITEKGKRIEGDICQMFIKQVVDNISDGDFLVLSGDASNTAVPYIYNVIIERLGKRGKKVKIFLDTSSENLIRGIKQQPFLVKPNVDELSQVIGRAIETEEEILEGIDQIASCGIPCVAVSRGGEGAMVRYGEEVYQIEALKVNVVNTIGCGDAFLSGLVYGFSKEMDLQEILKLATGVSAATAESELTVGFDYHRAMELKDQVVIRKVR